jgi:hypothetical protein
VCPENAGGRILLEQALDGVGIGVGMQHETVLPGERDHASRHRQIGIGAIQVKLADGDVALAGEAILQKGDERLVAYPGGDVSPGAIWAKRRQHEIGRLRDEALRPLVAGARDERAHDAGAAQNGDRILRRKVVPRVVAVVHVRIEDRKLGGDCSRAGERQRNKSE